MCVCVLFTVTATTFYSTNRIQDWTCLATVAPIDLNRQIWPNWIWRKSKTRSRNDYNNQEFATTDISGRVRSRRDGKHSIFLSIRFILRPHPISERKSLGFALQMVPRGGNRSFIFVGSISTRASRTWIRLCWFQANSNPIQYDFISRFWNWNKRSKPNEEKIMPLRARNLFTQVWLIVSETYVCCQP